MSRKRVEDRHSETALFATICRAVAAQGQDSGNLGTDFLAVNFLPPHVRFFIKFDKIREKFKAKNRKMTPGGYEYMLARTAFFDEKFKTALNQNVSQIVLLGSGYDTRAYRFSNTNKGTQIFELDAPTTQERKRKCLKKAGIEIPNNNTLVPVNFNNDSIEVVLADAGYSPTASTLFIWEGVSMYLEPNAIATILRLASDNPKSSLVFDYVISVSENNIDNLYGVRQFTETWLKHRKGEPFKFSIEENGLDDLIGNHGLIVTEKMNSKEMHDTFLSKDQDQITGFFGFAVVESK